MEVRCTQRVITQSCKLRTCLKAGERGKGTDGRSRIERMADYATLLRRNGRLTCHQGDDRTVPITAIRKRVPKQIGSVRKPQTMNKFEVLWYEVWTDEGLIPPYVLILMCVDRGAKFCIYDPTEGRMPFQAATYEEARDWLLEDEYTRVLGRMNVE